MIKIKKVSFGYETQEPILKDIELSIKQGECILLCGKSGCGKTTVTKLVNGLIPHFTEKGLLTGETTVAQMDIKTTPMYTLAKTIGSVFQNPKTQFFNIDSDSEMAFGLENEGASPDFINNRIDEITKFLKIHQLRSRNIFAMSGGEKQSLAFASICAVNPKIYVLDEPSANLDAAAIEILKEQLKKIKAEGKTILIAEHRLYYLYDLIDRVFYMEDGKLTYTFNKEAFFKLSDEDRVKLGLRTLIPSRLEAKQNAYCNEDDTFIVQNLCYEIQKKRILNHISFSASTGDIIGFIGYNGFGKTTLARCVSGLVKEKSGKVYFKGKHLKLKQRNKLSYMIMQDVNHQLFSDSVWGECELSRKDISSIEIEKVLKTFDLYDFKDRHPMALSGGQKQRLAIATGVLTDKPILIFDEPTSGLDYHHMVAVSQTIKQLARGGKIILLITHDLEFLNLTATKVVPLKGEGHSA